MLSVTKNIPNSSEKKADPSYGQKFVSFHHANQSIWQKLKKYSKFGQDFNNVLSDFSYFLAAIVNI